MSAFLPAPFDTSDRLLRVRNALMPVQLNVCPAISPG
jgi:hypothetical protein